MRGQAVLWPQFEARQAAVLAANAGRNLLASEARARSWEPARDELWRLIDPLIGCSARVAVIGAGNGHDLPLARLTDRASHVALVDIDRRAPRHARRRLPPDLRRKVSVVEHDVTAGAADAIIRATV